MRNTATNMGFAAMLTEGQILIFCSLSAAVRSDVIYSALVLIFNTESIGIRFRAGRYKVPAREQALFIVRHYYSPFQIMIKIDKKAFVSNLWVTQHYCDIQKTHTEKNSTSIFRSFNPQINGDTIFKFKLSDYGLEENIKFSFLTDWSIDPTDRENEYLIGDLFEKQLAHKKLGVVNNYSNALFSGEILVAQLVTTL